MRKDALEILQAALEAVQPAHLLKKWLAREGSRIRIGDLDSEKKNRKKLYVVSVGKAASAMAREAEHILGEEITGGLVITKYDHGLPLEILQTIEAAHPVPDENGVKAARELTRLLHSLNEGDLLLVLISGGASALLADIPPDISLQEFSDLSGLLLKSGADIGQLNTIRKHLSVFKGGQLVKSAWPATVVSLVLSDVMGDPPEVIASGPTVPDPSTFEDAWNILKQYGLDGQVSGSIFKHLKRGMENVSLETPKPGSTVFERSFYYLIGNNQLALGSAAKAAERMGYHVWMDQEMLSGEASALARKWVMKMASYKGPVPALLMAGGETTVTIRGNGKGGRNQEFVLAVLNEWKKNPEHLNRKILVMSAATDGTDGPTDSAGAWADNELFEDINRNNLDPEPYLANNDAYTFFKRAGAHLMTGPTQTNVMDVLMVFIEK